MILTLLLREHLVGVLAHPWTRVCLCYFLCSPAAAEDISWSSTFFEVNQDGEGEALDENFTFHLGVFDPPPPTGGDPVWVPTAGNTGEWASHWITADAVSYNTLTSSFSGSYDAVAQVEGVSLTGKQGYIWGLNRDGENGEWILVTNPSWIWPAPGSGGINGFGENWMIDGSTVILGAIDENGVHMKMATVSGSLPPLLRAQLWQEAHFSESEILDKESTVSGWLADPNKNGRSNLLEYALGTPPRSPQRDREPWQGFMEVSGEDFQTLSVVIDPATEALVSAEVSDDLVVWYSDLGDVAMEVSGVSSVMFRDLTPRSSANAFRAIRIRVTLPE